MNEAYIKISQLPPASGKTPSADLVGQTGGQTKRIPLSSLVDDDTIQVDNEKGITLNPDYKVSKEEVTNLASKVTDVLGGEINCDFTFFKIWTGVAGGNITLSHTSYASNGAIVTPIDVKPGEKFIVTTSTQGTSRCLFFSDDQGAIISVGPTKDYSESEVVVPAGASLMYVNRNQNTDFKLEKVSDILPMIYANREDIVFLKKGLIAEFDMTDSIRISNGAVSLEDGSVIANNTYRYAQIDLSRVALNQIKFDLSYFGTGVAAYGFFTDGEWNGVGGYHYTTPTPTTINVPNNAETCMLCWNANIVTDINISVVGIGVTPDGGAVSKMPYPFFPDFDLAKVPQMEIPSHSELIAANWDALLARYDSLVSAYPNYVTKIACDQEAQIALGITAPDYMADKPIYIYHFQPTRATGATHVDKGSRVKVFLTSNHPQERLGNFVMHRVMQMICEEWATYNDARLCRSLIDFYVMPTAWVWNYATGQRANYNGVNPNRNFPTANWAEAGAGTNNYTGPQPLSEYEAKILDYWVRKIKPDVSIDVHTSGNDSEGHMGIILCNQYDQSLINLLGVVCRTTSDRVLIDNMTLDTPHYPVSDPDKSLYGVYPEDGSASGEFYEYLYEQGCKYSVLSEESPYSNWLNGEFLGADGSISHTDNESDKIFREQSQYIFNLILRLTKAAADEYSN